MKNNNLPFRFILLWAISVFSMPLSAQKFEAESATLSGGAVKQALVSASGGYIVAQQEGSLAFTVSLDAGNYNIYICAASPSGNKINRFAIDGSSIDFSLEQNASYIKLKVISNLKLDAGNHSAEITKSWGWIKIDYIEFEKVDPSGVLNINKTLVTPGPTDKTARLYQFLYDIYGKKIISGVMTLNSMDEVNWLKTNTGKQPALVGLDFMHCGQGYTWYDDDTPGNDAIGYYNKNGIAAISWHWRDPSNKTEEFYSDKTSFDVSKIFDESSVEYTAMISDIDYISGLLKKIQDAGAPVLWRPLHEAAGGWFWWGAKGAAPCKKLFQVMYDRMVNHHGLRNLIWVWTREPNDDAWYPGDEYVDIVGRDIYKEGDHTSQVLEFNDLDARYGGKKMVAISECGSFPDVDNLVADGARWLYYMPWYGNFVRDPKYNPLDLWEKMFASDYVLTLDEMPDLKSYTTVGLNKLGNKDDLLIYPTLVSDEVNIRSETNFQDLNIYNSQGTLLKSVIFNSQAAVVSFVGFEPGIYFIRIGHHKPVKILKYR